MKHKVNTESLIFFKICSQSSFLPSQSTDEKLIHFLKIFIIFSIGFDSDAFWNLMNIPDEVQMIKSYGDSYENEQSPNAPSIQ